MGGRPSRIAALRLALVLGAAIPALPAAAQTIGYPSLADPGTAPVATDAGTSRRSRYVQPYVELNQVITHDLTNDDTLTYTALAAGIDAGVQTARADAQVSYRYERRFDWDDDVADQDIHTGLARGSIRLTPALSLEAGGLATRTRSDIRGDAPGNFAGNVDNVTQLYSLYAGPTFGTRAGPLDVSGAYRFGYTKVEAPGFTGVDPLLPALDNYNDSTSHLVTASVGVPANRIAPVGVTLSGAYEREDAAQLDQSYEGYYGRGDAVLPVSPTVALRGGVGYEKIEVKQRDALVRGGQVVTDGNGRFVTDPNSPARIAYDTDGLIYDAGVIWRPSPRLELQANAGYRYGGETYFGSLNWAMSKSMGLQVVVYDGIETFGRQLRDGVAALPTSFNSQIDPFDQQFSGCVFGAQPGRAGGVGGCLNDVFQSIQTASYRARGVDGVLSFQRGRNAMGVGAGYANRKLFAPRNAPGIVYAGVEDQSAYGQLFWSRQLSRVSAVDANVFVNWYAGGLPGSTDVYGYGANASYAHSFGRLGTLASIGVYGFDDELVRPQWSAQALLGARYSF